MFKLGDKPSIRMRENEVKSTAYAHEIFSILKPNKHISKNLSIFYSNEHLKT